MARDLKGPEYGHIFNHFCQNIGASSKRYHKTITSIIERYGNVEAEDELSTVFDISSFTAVQQPRERQRWLSGEHVHEHKTKVKETEENQEDGEFLVLKEENLNHTLALLLNDSDSEPSDGETISSCSDDSWTEEEEGEEEEEEEPSSNGYHDYPTKTSSLPESRDLAIDVDSGAQYVQLSGDPMQYGVRHSDGLFTPSHDRHHHYTHEPLIGKDDGLSMLKISSDKEDEVDGKYIPPISGQDGPTKLHLNSTYVVEEDEPPSWNRPGRDLHRVTSPHSYRKYVNFVTRETSNQHRHDHHGNDKEGRYEVPHSQDDSVREADKENRFVGNKHSPGEFMERSMLSPMSKERKRDTEQSNFDTLDSCEEGNGAGAHFKSKENHAINKNCNLHNFDDLIEVPGLKEGHPHQMKTNLMNVPVTVGSVCREEKLERKPLRRIATIFTPFNDERQEATSKVALSQPTSDFRLVQTKYPHVDAEQTYENLEVMKMKSSQNEHGDMKNVENRKCEISKEVDDGLIYLDAEEMYSHKDRSGHHSSTKYRKSISQTDCNQTDICIMEGTVHQNLSDVRHVSLHQNQSSINEHSLRKDSGISTFHTESSFGPQAPQQILTKLTLKNVADFNSSLLTEDSLVNVSPDSKNISLSMCPGSAIKVEQWLKEVEPDAGKQIPPRQHKSSVSEKVDGQKCSPLRSKSPVQNFFLSPESQSCAKSGHPLRKLAGISPHSGKVMSQWNELADNIINSSAARDKGKQSPVASPGSQLTNVEPAKVFRQLKYGENENSKRKSRHEKNMKSGESSKVSHSERKERYRESVEMRLPMKRLIRDMMEDAANEFDEMEYSPVPVKSRRTCESVARRTKTVSNEPIRCVETQEDMFLKPRQQNENSFRQNSPRQRGEISSGKYKEASIRKDLFDSGKAAHEIHVTELYDEYNRRKDQSDKNYMPRYCRSNKKPGEILKQSRYEGKEQFDNNRDRKSFEESSSESDLEDRRSESVNHDTALKDSYDNNEIAQDYSCDLSGRGNLRSPKELPFKEQTANPSEDILTGNRRRSHSKQSPRFRATSPRNSSQVDHRSGNLRFYSRQESPVIDLERMSPNVRRSIQQLQLREDMSVQYPDSPEISHRNHGSARKKDFFSPSASMARLKLNTPKSRSHSRSHSGHALDSATKIERSQRMQHAHTPQNVETFQQKGRQSEPLQKFPKGHHDSGNSETREGYYTGRTGEGYRDGKDSKTSQEYYEDIGSNYELCRDGGDLPNQVNRGRYVDDTAEQSSCHPSRGMPKRLSQRGLHFNMAEQGQNGPTTYQRHGQHDQRQGQHDQRQGQHDQRQGQHDQRPGQHDQRQGQHDQRQGQHDQRQGQHDQRQGQHVDRYRQQGSGFVNIEHLKTPGCERHANIQIQDDVSPSDADWNINVQKGECSNKDRDNNNYGEMYGAYLSSDYVSSKENASGMPSCFEGGRKSFGHSQTKTSSRRKIHKQLVYSENVNAAKHGIDSDLAAIRENTSEMDRKLKIPTERRQIENLQETENNYLSTREYSVNKNFKIPTSPSMNARNLQVSPRQSHGLLQVTSSSARRLIQKSPSRSTSTRSPHVPSHHVYNPPSYHSTHPADVCSPSLINGLVQSPPAVSSETCQNLPSASHGLSKNSHKLTSYLGNIPHSVVSPQTEIRGGRRTDRQPFKSNTRRSVPHIFQSSPVRPGAKFSLDLTLSTIAGPEETSSEADSRNSSRVARRQGKLPDDDDIVLIDA